MTDSERSLCDCPEPCGCYAEGYAAGKDKAYFEVIDRSSPGIFEKGRVSHLQANQPNTMPMQIDRPKES